MNRRGFVGATLAVVGGFLFPRKLLALINKKDDSISSEELLYRILENSQGHVVVVMHSPMYCRVFKKKVNCHILDSLDCLLDDDAFGFNDGKLRAVIPIDNIITMSAVLKNGTRMICVQNHGRWTVYVMNDDL